MTGEDEPYVRIINRLYTLDSQLQLYNSSRKNDNKDNSKSSTGRNNKNSTPSTSTKTNSSNPAKNHESLELGKPAKPLAQMSLTELKTYIDSLPRSATISNRCRKEGRCHVCQERGHMKSNPDCPAKRLESTSVNAVATNESEQGKKSA